MNFFTVGEIEEGETDGAGAAIVLYYKTNNRFRYVGFVKGLPSFACVFVSLVAM